MKSSTNGVSASELALIAAAVTTIGDGLATIAAALALQEEQEQQPSPSTSNAQQRQIDQLQRDIRAIKHMLHIR